MLKIADHQFSSRLFLGSGKYGSSKEMYESIIASDSEMVTVALKRIDTDAPSDDLIEALKKANVKLWPNTSGVRNAKEAVFAAQLAREALETNWIKLEIHPDPRYLMPDPIETLKATEDLAKLGFIVLPYIHADPVLCKRLEDAGTAAVMPLGSPIGSNKGLKTEDFLEIIIEQSKVPVIVDAGIGAPSHAAKAMEMGADAVLVNTAIASSKNSIQMAIAFKNAVLAGRMAYEAGLSKVNSLASATSPLTSFLNEIKRILKPNGILLIIEHDAIHSLDSIIIDLQHTFYSYFVDKYKNPKNYKNYIQHPTTNRYLNKYEWNYLLQKHDLKYITSHSLYNNTPYETIYDNQYYAFYKNIKS